MVAILGVRLGRERSVTVFIRIGIAWIVVCLIVAPSSYGIQNSPTAGTLGGTIRDLSGAFVPGAMITVRSAATNQIRRTSSSGDGSYRLLALPVGDYELRVEVPGFDPYVNPNLTIALGRTVLLDVTLKPAGVAENVSVIDQPPPIDPTATATTTTIDPERIEELPVNSRNYLEFTLLAPGVAPSNTQSNAGTRGQFGSPLADSGFTFGGLRPRSNSIAIDGLDNTDETTGAARVALSPEIVREFQIINNGISAESGGAAGGAINVVTKTGTNDFHGDAFVFGQNELFNARESVTAKVGIGRPLFHRYQPGVSLGGPIQHDRLFFYMAAEQEHLLADSAADIPRPARDRINAALASGLAPNLAVRLLQAGRFRIGTDETEAAGKLTYVAARHTVNSRFAFTNARLRGEAFNTEELNDISSRGTSFTKDYQLTASDTIVLSPRSINEFRFQASTRRALSNGGDRVGPGVDIVGVARFGRPFDADSARRENRLQFLDNIIVERGHHELKAGITVNHVKLRSEMRDGFGGLFIFRTVDDFLAGRAAEWHQAFGTPGTDFSVTSAGAFVQDRYEPIRNLTLNLGARYDIERLPQSFPTDYHNISPRIGLAWNPSSVWVLRSGFGLYYDRIPLAFLNRAIQKDGNRAFEQVAGDAVASNIFSTIGGHVASPFSTIAPSIFRADPAFVTPYSVQANASVERLISKDVTARADYLFTRGIHLLRTRNINLVPPLSGPDGRAMFGPERIDPRFDAIYLLESSAASTYHGLTLSLNKRLSNEFELLASYTLSKVIDDASDFDEQPQNPYNLRGERALSRQDVRNRLVVNGLFDLPIGEDENDRGQSQTHQDFLTKVFGRIEAAPIFTFSSGRPVNVLTGADEERSRAYPLASRPLGLGRNTLRTPRFFNVDLRIVKYFPYGERRRLDFTAEAFNLLNHPNVVAVNAFYGAGLTSLPGFGTATGFAAPRQIRFSIDFEF